MRILAVITLLSVFMVQCAPIGQPYRNGVKEFIEKVPADEKANLPQTTKQLEEPKPFFTGSHKFEDLKTYEIPKEILPYVPDHLKPADKSKPRLVIHNPILEVDMDKSKMSVTLELEIPGTDVKEQLSLEGDFSKTDPMWNADLFPTDEKIAEQRKVQAIVACLDAHYCKNIAIRIYYKYKNEILEEQVESNKNIVRELEIDESIESEESEQGHTHGQPNKPTNLPNILPPPKTEPEQEQPQQAQPTVPQQPSQQPAEPKQEQPVEPVVTPSAPSEKEEQAPADTTTDKPSPKTIKPIVPQPKSTEEEQNPSELDYLLHMIWKKIVPDKKPEQKAEQKIENENKVEKKNEDKEKEEDKKRIEPIKVDPPKPSPAPVVPAPQQQKQPEAQKQVEAPAKKIEPIQAKPQPKMEDLAKLEKSLSVAMPTPLPAPKTDDKRSIVGLKDKIFIPSKEEACSPSADRKDRRCQSHGSHDEGSLQGATEFPLQSVGVMSSAKSIRGNYRVVWGNSMVIEAILKASEELNRKYSSSKPLLVTQISKQAGGRSDVSKSHQNGLDVDILWPGNGYSESIQSDNKTLLKTNEYERTLDFMKSLVCAERSHIRLFFVDQNIKTNLCKYAKAKYPEQMKNPNSCEYRTLYSMMHWPGHGDHMHVRSHCPRYERCLQKGTSVEKAPKECIHAFCQEEFVIPDKRHNIGC